MAQMKKADYLKAALRADKEGVDNVADLMTIIREQGGSVKVSSVKHTLYQLRRKLDAIAAEERFVEPKEGGGFKPVGEPLEEKVVNRLKKSRDAVTRVYANCFTSGGGGQGRRAETIDDLLV